MGSKVKVWYDQQTVEFYHDYQRVALHIRVAGRRYHTIGEHMPLNHQQAKSAKGWTKEELLTKA